MLDLTSEKQSVLFFSSVKNKNKILKGQAKMKIHFSSTQINVIE